MGNQDLYHYGVPGMRWGIRKNRGSSSKGFVKKNLGAGIKKGTKDIAEQIRLKRLRKKYTELQYSTKVLDMSKAGVAGAKFAKEVLKDIGNNTVQNLSGQEESTIAFLTRISKDLEERSR